MSSSHDVFEQMSPEELVSRATDFIIKPDWDINLYIAERLNNKPEWVKPVLTEIEKKLHDEERQVGVFAITLLDTCLKNSWAVADVAANKHYLASLGKVALDSKTPYELSNAILEALVSWAASFQRSHPAFGETIAIMVGKGAKLPPVTTRFEPPVNPFTVAPQARSQAPSYPGSSHLPVASHAGAPVSAPVSSGPITQAQIVEIRGRLELVFDVFGALNPQQEDVTRNEIIQEFYPICAQFQTQIVQSFENGTASEGLLEQLLTLNDELIRAKETYQRLCSQHSGAPSVQQQHQQYPPQQPQQHQRPQSSLLDLDMGGPPSYHTPSHPSPQPPVSDFSSLSLNNPTPSAPKFAPSVASEVPSDFIPMLAPPPGAKRSGTATSPTRVVAPPPTHVPAPVTQPFYVAPSHSTSPFPHTPAPTSAPTSAPSSALDDNDPFAVLLSRPNPSPPTSNSLPSSHIPPTTSIAPSGFQHGGLTPQPAPAVLLQQPAPGGQKKDALLDFLLN